ncbi:MAG TPA: acyl-ACP desaturase [Acidimicrobiales bacterium]|jgi:acyl-[acyl-carrier-protein] desaturase|nr:acyl-ACP desaturase [Acidimicrobiales bacterium]
MNDRDLLDALAPTAETLLHRHYDLAKEWFPHDLVPWSQARDFEPGWEWDPAEATVDPAVRSALFVNLLTEDNLPYYFATLARVFGDGVWGVWARRWTAEEGRHALVIRDWLTATRAIDPVELERARMEQVSSGIVPEPQTAADAIAYVALQELATRVSHRNTGKLLDDPAGEAVMKRVAADENLHYLFYKDLAVAAIELDPSGMVLAIERQVVGFEMPGTGIRDFRRHALAIAAAGIYDLGLHHSEVLAPVVLRQWRLEQLTGLSDEAETARDRTLRHMARLESAGRRMTSRRDEKRGAKADAAAS